MSNPFTQVYDDLRSPYLQEKKAKKDYDGDGKVESGSKEHAGVVHNAIQKKKGGKPDGQDTRSEGTAYGIYKGDGKVKIGQAPRKQKGARIGQIFRRGANHLICVDENKEIFRAWISEAKEVDKLFLPLDF